MDTYVCGVLFPGCDPAPVKRARRERRKQAMRREQPACQLLPGDGLCLHCGEPKRGYKTRGLCRPCYEDESIRYLLIDGMPAYPRSRRGRPEPGRVPPDFGPEIDGDDTPLPGPHASTFPGPLPEDYEARIAELQRRIFAGMQATAYTDGGARRREVVGAALAGCS